MSDVNVGGRLQARRRTKEHYQRNSRGGGRNIGRYLGYRLKIGDKPIRLRPRRPSAPYPDPVDPTIGYHWKYGFNRYFKGNPKYPNGIPVEWHPETDIFDAYTEPSKFGFQDLPQVAAHQERLKKFPKKPYYCISGWVEEWHHLVKHVSDDGERTWVRKEQCTGKGCKLCKEGHPRSFGNRFWIDFSGAQWMTAIDKMFEQLERYPKDPKTGAVYPDYDGYVYPLHYACEGCGEILTFHDRRAGVDVSLDITNRCINEHCRSENVVINEATHMASCEDCGQEWTLLTHEDESLRRQLDTVHECVNCGHQGYAVPVFEHSLGEEEWETIDLFDVSFRIYKQSEGDKGGRLYVKDWEPSEPDPRLFDPEYQVVWPANKKLTPEEQAFWDDQATKQAEWMNKELDLNELHQPMSPDEQANLVQVDNLFAIGSAESDKGKQKRFQPRGGRMRSEEAASED